MRDHHEGDPRCQSTVESVPPINKLCACGSRVKKLKGFNFFFFKFLSPSLFSCFFTGSFSLPSLFLSLDRLMSAEYLHIHVNIFLLITYEYVFRVTMRVSLASGWTRSMFLRHHTLKKKGYGDLCVYLLGVGVYFFFFYSSFNKERKEEWKKGKKKKTTAQWRLENTSRGAKHTPVRLVYDWRTFLETHEEKQIVLSSVCMCVCV